MNARMAQSIGRLAIALLSSVTLLAAACFAADNLWNGATDNWSNGNNWSAGVPGYNADAFLPQNPSQSYLVTFDTDYALNNLRSLKISGYFSNGLSNSTTFNQTTANYNMFTSGNEFIGYDGKGLATYNQSIGNNIVSSPVSTGTLYVGYGPTASGAYNLSGGMLSISGVDGGTEFIGYAGTGTFTQTGGTNTATNETIGGPGVNAQGTYSHSSGSNTTTNLTIGGATFSSAGLYTLGGDGSLSVTNESINNSGTFTQTGGFHTSSSLTVGGGLGGTFNLQGGTVNSMLVQVAMGGRMIHSGGTFTGVIDVKGGRYALSGNGTFSSTSVNQINLSDGDFYQTGGSLGPTTVVTQTGGTVTGALVNTGTFNYSGGTFSGTLWNQGAVNFTSDFSASGDIRNDATMTIPAGRTVSAAGLLFYNAGLVNLNGGKMDTNNLMANDGFIYGNGAISSAGGIYNNASIIQSSGNLAFTTGSGNPVANSGMFSLTSGYISQLVGTTTLSNSGVVNLNGGLISGGTFTNTGLGTLIGPGTIASAFSNSGYLDVTGGAVHIFQPFGNSGTIHLSGAGSSLLGGAIFANTGSIEGAGSVGNPITNSTGGTVEAIGGTLSLGGTLQNQSGGVLRVGPGNKLVVAAGLATNGGLITLTGGTFDNNGHVLSNSGQISGYGTFASGGLTNNGSITFTGGTTTINGDVTNQATHTITVTHDPAIFTGNVINNGTFKTTGTTTTFAGTYSENGTFISDPATQNFQDLVIGSGGALVGGAGDVFNIAGNLLNHSVRNSNWDTRDAEIAFSGGGSHALAWSGADLGPGLEGFDRNFAIGKLILAAGDSLTLEDGDTHLGAAIYVQTLDLAGGLGQITSIAGNGVNIDYDPRQPGNAYLNGGTYALRGGGFIQAVPEPSSIVLLGIGAVLFLASAAGRNRGVRGRETRAQLSVGRPARN